MSLITVYLGMTLWSGYHMYKYDKRSNNYLNLLNLSYDSANNLACHFGVIKLNEDTDLLINEYTIYNDPNEDYDVHSDDKIHTYRFYNSDSPIEIAINGSTFIIDESTKLYTTYTLASIDYSFINSYLKKLNLSDTTKYCMKERLLRNNEFHCMITKDDKVVMIGNTIEQLVKPLKKMYELEYIHLLSYHIASFVFGIGLGMLLFVS
jgi:hypothetical protein